jgi:hypothetical protein
VRNQQASVRKGDVNEPGFCRFALAKNLTFELLLASGINKKDKLPAMIGFERIKKPVCIMLLLLIHAAAHSQGRNKKFLEAATHGKYKPGFYTLLNGTRHAGNLRIWQNLEHNVLQVDQGKAEPLNLPPAELRGFVAGVDSFVVLHDVAVAGMPAMIPFGETDFFRVVLKGRLQVLEHDQLVPGSYNAQYGGGPQHSLMWVMRPVDGVDFVVIPWQQQAFAQHVAGLFVDNALLCQRIRAGLVGPDDFKRIIYAYIFKKEIEQVTYEDAATIFQ